MSENENEANVDFNDKVIFKSGATSGGTHPPYELTTGYGEKVTAERFGYGNRKHENGQTVLADANWLKAFHARDIDFFRDRINHAAEHIRKEQHGQFDPNPGGNWGAVGWCVDVMEFVKRFDRLFYLAIVGLTPHPGERVPCCLCDRCMASRTGLV